jgi:uncharacterized membrane protein
VTSYELLLFLHVSASIIWLGGGFLITLLVFGAARAGEREREAGYHRDVGWLAPRLYIPASLATLIFGILVAIDGDWPFDLWLVIGLAGWLVAFLLGFFYFRPEGERIAGLVEAHGPGNQEADWRLHRLNLVDRVQVTILFLVVADMVIKPTGDDTGILILGAAVVALATAWAAGLVRGYQPAAPAYSQSTVSSSE